jgi:hypothetical protein
MGEREKGEICKRDRNELKRKEEKVKKGRDVTKEKDDKTPGKNEGK